MSTYMPLAVVWIAVIAAVIVWAAIKFIVESIDED